MKIALRLLGYEIFVLVLCWMNLRTPMLENPDGQVITTGSIVVSVHVYAYSFLLVFVAFWMIFSRLWKDSNRRRR